MPLPDSDHTPAQVLHAIEAKWAAAIQSTTTGSTHLRSDTPDSLPSWMLPSQASRLHWSQRQQQRQEQQQQQQQPQPQPQQTPLQQAAADDTVDVLLACGGHSEQSRWRRIWELASAPFIDRQHRILWWRILHGCLMCGAYKAYIHRATPQQANCPLPCCQGSAQLQTVSHLFLTCPAAATAVGWLCRLWQAITGHLPDASVSILLAADTSSWQLPTKALLETWHRLRLAVLHSIWLAAQIARSQAAAPIAASSTADTQSTSASGTSPAPHFSLASRMALKTVIAMIQQDWIRCSEDVKQVSGVCSEWLRGRDPSMTLEAFQDRWCYNGVLASVNIVETSLGRQQLELQVKLSSSCPVQLC